MSLSERARQYIETLTRRDQFTSSVEETKAYLISQEIERYEHFLHYQVEYSGYELTILNDPGHRFSCQLFSKKQISENEESGMITVGDRQVRDCGIHLTVQINFFLTDRGELCTLDDNDLPNIVYGSFDKFVEEYALRNQISHWDSNPYYFDVLKAGDLTEHMNNRFKVIEECSDKTTQWWADEKIVAVRGVGVDRPDFYFHVYGAQRQFCEDLIDDLRNLGILKK